MHTSDSPRLAPFTALACPLDGEPLHKETQTWRCSQGHTFDIARQGHVNLLPVQHKKAKEPGDSKAMVAARREFLALGYYQPIASALVDAVNATVSGASPYVQKPTCARRLAAEGSGASPFTQEPLRCLDAGCGEGYYLRELTQQSPHPFELIGVDISKWAILAAAKQCRQNTWVVGTNARLPVQSASLDYVFCLFGFPVYEEFARVLKPEGKLIMIDPAPEHLLELRQQLYANLTEKESKTTFPPELFSTIYHTTARHGFKLHNAQEIQHLLLMTPHWFRAKASQREQVLTLEQLSTQIAVNVKVLQKAQPSA